MIPELVVVLGYMLWANIPFVPQQWANDCGAAAAASVIQYYTESAPTSRELMQAIDSEGPIATWEIVEALGIYGLKAEIFVDVEVGLRPGDIVLVDSSVWKDLGLQESGGRHWVTIASVDEHFIGIMDPKAGGRVIENPVFWAAYRSVVVRADG